MFGRPGFCISEISVGKGAICRAILSALPEWFGIADAIDSYVVESDELPMLTCQTADGDIVGFLSLKFHTQVAAEVHLMSIRREWHRRGLGRLLFDAAEVTARAQGARYITVKTVAASHPDPHYHATRLFYEAIGFDPIEIFPTLWNSSNPCLLMLKRLN